MVYTVKQLSEILGKDPETIRRWCRTKKVKAILNSKKEGYLIEYNFENENKKAKLYFDIIRKTYLFKKIDSMDSEKLDKLEEFIDNLMKGE